MAFGSSMRDRTIVAAAVVVVMYVFAGVLWYANLKDRGSLWNRSQNSYQDARKTYLKERKLISERLMWNDAYDEEREKMPTFPEGEDVDTHWLAKMDSIAKANHVSIGTRQPEKEEEVGDVYELPVKVSGWEGALEPLVKFLYELEHADEAMFDVKSILIRPSSHKGFLKGQFTLTCAYMRGDVEEEADDDGEKKKEKTK